MRLDSWCWTWSGGPSSSPKPGPTHHATITCSGTPSRYSVGRPGRRATFQAPSRACAPHSRSGPGDQGPLVPSSRYRWEQPAPARCHDGARPPTLTSSDSQTTGNTSTPIHCLTHLVGAVEDVARALDLATDWLNPGPASMMDFGLPPGFERRVSVRTYGGLEVHVAGRADLICFKLYAAVDSGPRASTSPTCGISTLPATSYCSRLGGPSRTTRRARSAASYSAHSLNSGSR